MAIAFYLRLSLADGDLGKDHKEESNSIENQRLLLQSFVEAREDLYGDIREFIDDGYSGTNFERPAFKEMIEEAKKGKIQVIIVKDFSRLGRDYIGVGDYLEQIFPVLGIRFIAINSTYDSNDYIGKTMGLEMSISNLINALYSKDLSKKYRSAVQTKWKQGKSTACRTPYGYLKNKEDPSKWVLDPVAAANVRLIFEKAIQGWNTGMIASYMNENQIPPPGMYREKTSDYMQWNRKVAYEEWLWTTFAVWRILKSYSYTGALVQGVTAPICVGSKSRRLVPLKDRVIVDGVHPPIITVEEYHQAQLAIHRAERNTIPQKTGFSLGGKIRCGNCGLSMSYHGRGYTPNIACRHKRSAGKHSKCDSTMYPAEQIESIVFHALKTKLTLFCHLDPIIRDHVTRQKRLGEGRRLTQNMETLKAKRIHQYEAYAEGIISKGAYLQVKEQLTLQIDQLQGQLAVLNSMESEEDMLANQVSDMASQAEIVSHLKKLTEDIANMFVKSVVIYGPNRMEITFHFEGLLQKAMEKAEEISASDETKTVSYAIL
jgi:hypothetical protein